MIAKNKHHPLQRLINHYGIIPHKKMGQNFLLDLNLIKKIANTSGSLDGITVLEIGPGPGNLTLELLALGAKKVIVIEKDQQFLPILEEISFRYPNRIEIIQGNALKFDLKEFSHLNRPIRIISNLPYNIGTRLLFDWITPLIWPPCWESLTLLFQKEVGQRIVAKENDSNYGRISVLTGWRTESRMVFDIPPQAFFPSPKITSTVVHITPRLKPIPCCLESLKKVTREAFGQRRKTLRQSLKTLGGKELLHRSGIESSLRAENIAVEDFCRIASLLSKENNPMLSDDIE
ncbi:16S rRNA (adenine(1518)-N(6)/adenine(1519)-N(6))-dimethyltransferase RsmA [Candidatus Liberibacter sp.]|uniref:16S rRNA (adenine(1518)-N(6)/adenine(1519)-N(6))- dimethyltransferase RsmA n=1 Tax=Candidatus Liberibacter sp. TaxID=34022 RepID=UPI0015F3924D|nr:16S rRNA (adenine(1518)-N(6)/adenine(1519)-N(6))-dimethyltransferase RsmA [Candidatus Liberibacter sp.]MBA5724224.1 16S rRNA (adenine(1518)-N(6)/adenine(1519)-N(6))-dimethyltransferase RsmA [Candidatus Liberibacter sp.]